MTTQSKILANQQILQTLERQIHMLNQSILPPELETVSEFIWKNKEDRVPGMLRAKLADVENVKHIIAQYEQGAMK